MNAKLWTCLIWEIRFPYFADTQLYLSFYMFYVHRDTFIIIHWHMVKSGDQNWQQLDYILEKHQCANNMKHEQALPGANIDSDHNILIAKTCSMLKKIINFQKAKLDEIWGSYILNNRKVPETLEEKHRVT